MIYLNIFFKSGASYYGGLLITLFLIQPMVAQESIWLSNTPPDTMLKEIKTSGMHRYSSLKSKPRGDRNKRTSDKTQYKKSATDSTNKTRVNTNVKKPRTSYKRPSTKYVHWLRQGSSIENAKYICLSDSTDYELKMLSPVGKNVPIEMVNNKVCYAKFELNEEGYYNTYLIVKYAEGDTLNISIAKAEILSHSCRNGHHKKLEARPVKYYPEITDFEMIRQRDPHEDYHFFTGSGDTETYKTLLEGNPIEGVKVRVNTEKGWSKSFTTDDSGEFSTEFIQDYFSNWKELNTRKIHYYMLEAEYTLKKDVAYKGKQYSYIHYTLTMSDGYRPARSMYTSMFWGLIVFLSTMILSILGIFVYKERRKRPYKEITFNESNK